MSLTFILLLQMDSIKRSLLLHSLPHRTWMLVIAVKRLRLRNQGGRLLFTFRKKDACIVASQQRHFQFQMQAFFCARIAAFLCRVWTSSPCLCAFFSESSESPPSPKTYMGGRIPVGSGTETWIWSLIIIFSICLFYCCYKTMVCNPYKHYRM